MADDAGSGKYALWVAVIGLLTTVSGGLFAYLERRADAAALQQMAQAQPAPAEEAASAAAAEANADPDADQADADPAEEAASDPR